jgi:2-keto-4-pentenoate hydratase
MKTPYAAGLAEQIALLRSRLDAGMPRLGWKVGINVPEVQRKVGLAHALVGWLDGDRLFQSGAAVPLPRGGKIHVEPELCLRIAKSVSSTTDREAARGAVDAIAPALELVDYARPASSLADVVRGCMFHYATVLGAWQPPRDDLNIASGVFLRVDSLQSDAARADLVPTQLADLVLLVAKRLAEADQQLLPGDHIISGSFTATAIPLVVGQTADATLGDFGVVRCAAAA